MHTRYTELLLPSHTNASETKAPYHFLTERHLQVAWLEQKYFLPLKTHDGLSIEVISPGYWNAEAGPDFRMAHLIIDGMEWRGDVEIHFFDDSWIQHGHQEDPRYNDVVLHVGFWAPRTFKEITTQAGKNIFAVHLENFMTVKLDRLVDLIDLDLYPYKKFVGSGHCAQALFQSLPEKEIESLMSTAAFWRLSAKYQFLAQYENKFLAGFAMALGYKRNQLAFLKLFQNGCGIHLEEEQLFALLLDAAGLLENPPAKWLSSLRFCHLKRLRHESAIHLPPVQLDRANIRPFNHPVRRLALLAKIMRLTDLQTTFDRVWEINWSQMQAAKSWQKMQNALLETFPAFEDPYWSRHYTFETSPLHTGLPLLGPDIKQTILINTYFPILYHAIQQRANPLELNAFSSFYHSFKGQDSGKVSYLSHRFFGDTPKKQLLKSQISQQGALQIHRDFCMHYEASCVGCPFVEQYKTLT